MSELSTASELDLGALLDGAREEAFRLELLPVFSVPEEADQLAAFLAGALPPPPSEALREWCDHVGAQRGAGRRHLRLRVLPEALPPYLLFEIEWGYVHTVPAGEDIRFIDRAEFERLSPVRQDFWLIDGVVGALMDYTPEGAFLGVHAAPEEQLADLRAVRDLHERGRPLEAVLSEIRTGRLAVEPLRR